MCAVFVVRQTRLVRARAPRGSFSVEITRPVDTSAPAEGRRVVSVAALRSRRVVYAGMPFLLGLLLGPSLPPRE